MTQTKPQTSATIDLVEAIRARVLHWTLRLIDTPPGAARPPIYASIKDLERLLEGAKRR